MKHLRLSILVLLAVLLPLRGAMAVAMTCPQGHGPQAASAVVGHEHHDMRAHHAGSHADHRADEHAANQETPAGEHGDHAGTYKFCNSGCCATPLASAALSVASPPLGSSVTFPALCTPVAAFQSEGQERPPRTV